MPLERKINEREMALLEVVSDPIWLGEWLRTTNDAGNDEGGEDMPFEYRWYQKDWLTDQSPNIVFVAGRAVGKCTPATARIYTYPWGYMTLNDLIPKLYKQSDYFVVWAMDAGGKPVQRRAYITPNGDKQCYRVLTESGYSLDMTDNHPIYTPNGYKELHALKAGDLIGVTGYLPHNSSQNSLTWAELRWFGYVFGYERITPEMEITLKFQAHVDELIRISEVTDTHFDRTFRGTYRLIRKKTRGKHHMMHLIKMLRQQSARTTGAYKIPYELKCETLDNIKIFMESYYSLHAEITKDAIVIRPHVKRIAEDFQELLLRFSINSRVEQYGEKWQLSIKTPNEMRRFFSTFTLPGIAIKNNVIVDAPKEFVRFEAITSIEDIGVQRTYAVSVDEHHNYISDNLLVHNSLVMSDKMIYEIVNADTMFKGVRHPASTLATANVNQMTPLLDIVISRCLTSKFLSTFVDKFNGSKGTFDFKMTGKNYRLNTRIAGSKAENNMVGLHVNRIKIDEAQIFPWASYIQLLPTLNTFEPNTQMHFCGVPNGQREGNVLFFADQLSTKFKKYRIPAHENPYYSKEDDVEAHRAYGEEYERLVLGHHGNPTFSIISRDNMIVEQYPFYSYRYSGKDKNAGKRFDDVIKFHTIPERYRAMTVLALDTGYADPTVGNIICCDIDGVWRTMYRFRLQRIPFPEQANVIDYLDSFYNFNVIAIDLGAGGGGIGVMQDLSGDRFPKSRQYSKRIYGVRFSDMMETGEDIAGNVLKMNAKSYAGVELARMIADGELRFSELDQEGMDQLERVAYQRRADGINQYYVLSETGKGKTGDDHIFASYIVFMLARHNITFTRKRPKLFAPSWIQ